MDSVRVLWFTTGCHGNSEYMCTSQNYNQTCLRSKQVLIRPHRLNFHDKYYTYIYMHMHTVVASCVEKAEKAWVRGYTVVHGI